MVKLILIWWKEDNEKDFYQLKMNNVVVLEGGDEMFPKEDAYMKCLDDVGISYEYYRERRSLVRNKVWADGKILRTNESK